MTAKKKKYDLEPAEPLGKVVKSGNKDRTIADFNKSLVLEIKLRNPTASHEMIAKEFERVTGVPTSSMSVGRYLAQIREEWAEKRVEDMTMYTNMELARLDALEQETWDAWRASMQVDFEEELVELVNPGDYPAAREMARKVSQAVQKELIKQGSAGIDRDTVEDVIMDRIPPSTYQALAGVDAGLVTSRIQKVVRRSKAGNDRFLRLILDIQKERRKMLGLYQPERKQVDIRQVSVKGYAANWSPDAWDAPVIEGVMENPMLPYQVDEADIIGDRIVEQELANIVMNEIAG